ncbi:16S rRNA (guanine(966)-N(2))-methyltransferase RsmD [Arenibacter nanhaiticus]|uniref:16S rRNA (Guanine(966)-N(2))-methyltransferase RsmD n=1 Tax=Arenibacter nanhaiticus TaxID=558155 RepID=A0A1M6LRB5_9FLAO|nr:RsmD family RNA methyltransferase [Arenibacter nanhaiticus]SHJ73788.1 16S rRNA (guanine(966)-N(2))-methyltransferase RsmD [Arenibacter nanhaiticus]
MRIISGKHKGRRLTAPKKLPVRPTTDMAKEALFNILNNEYYFTDLSLLDLFAGTGNISYEFASRGTEQITCVDADAGCIKYITDTAKELEFTISTIKSDVFQYLLHNPIKAHIIFADPPYDLSFEEFSQIPKMVFDKDLLLKNGVLIIEHPKHTDLSVLDNFTYQRRYGGSVFSFFEYQEKTS